MATIAQVFGLRTQPLDKPSRDIALNCGIGIEVELEDISHLDIPMWDCITDGSLRNGMEFVCSRPYSGIQLKKAITNFSVAMDAARPNGTWRCSTHVHMDMRDTDIKVLRKTILAYVFYEKVLYGCSGEHRYHSNFAPAMNAVQDQLLTLSSYWNLEDTLFIRHVVNGWSKYSSMNLKPLCRYGSVEFRISEPKWQKENLMLLVNRFLTLKSLAEVSPEDESCEDFVNKLWELGISPLRPYLVNDYLFEESHLTEGYINAHDVLSLRSAGTAIFDYIAETSNTSVTEEREISVPNMGHWSNIYRYLCRHQDGETNNTVRATTNWIAFNETKEEMRISVEETEGLLPYSTFTRIIEFFETNGKQDLRQAMTEVRAAFERANELAEIDF